MTAPTIPAFSHLMRVQLQVARPQLLAELPEGSRKFVAILGGEFSGEKLKGTVLPGGGDWLLQGGDSAQLNARYVLQTHDGALIYLQDHGFRHGPAEVMQRLVAGEPVDPAEYYFRTSARLESSAPDYAWLNHRIIVGSGARLPQGVMIDFYCVE